MNSYGSGGCRLSHLTALTMQVAGDTNSKWNSKWTIRWLAGRARAGIGVSLEDPLPRLANGLRSPVAAKVDLGLLP